MDAHLQELSPYQPDHHLQYSQIYFIHNSKPFTFYTIMSIFICFGKSLLIRVLDMIWLRDLTI